MGSPPSEPGVHQQKKVSLSGDLQPSLSGFSGGDMLLHSAANASSRSSNGSLRCFTILAQAVTLCDREVTSQASGNGVIRA